MEDFDERFGRNRGRMTIYQDGRERYRVSLYKEEDGSVGVHIVAFVYDPGSDRVILDTSTDKRFPNVAEAEAWIEKVTNEE